MASLNAQAPVDAPEGGTDRRTRLTDTIDALVRLRQEMVVRYCALAGVSSFDRRDVEKHSVRREKLRSFCQIMVDYTAMGHFEVYERIDKDQERRGAVREVAASVYPGIAETTDYLVIAVRGELEDKILAALASR